jgi:hypothetical protein
MMLLINAVCINAVCFAFEQDAGLYTGLTPLELHWNYNHASGLAICVRVHAGDHN